MPSRVIVDGFDLTPIAKQAVSSIKHNRSDYDDLMQVAYLAMSMVIRSGKVDSQRNANGYLYIIARNAILKHLERYSYRIDNNNHRRGLPTTISDNNKHKHRIEDALDFDTKLDRLPDHYRRVVIMYCNGYTLRDIAQQEGVTDVAIRARLIRAAKQIAAMS